MVNGMTNAAYLKSLREAAAERGDCYVCRARPAKLGRRSCQDCLDRVHDAKVRLHAERRAAGLCHCGAPAERGILSCRKHRDVVNARSRTQRARKIARGLCMCGALLDTGRVNCSRCADKIAAHQYRRYYELKAAGICIYCAAEPAGEHTLTCDDCTKKQRACQQRYQDRKAA